MSTTFYNIKPQPDLDKVLLNLRKLLESSPGYYDMILNFIQYHDFALSGSMLLWAMQDDTPSWMPSDADLYNTSIHTVSELSDLELATRYCYRGNSSPLKSVIMENIVHDASYYATLNCVGRSNLEHEAIESFFVDHMENYEKDKYTVAELLHPIPKGKTIYNVADKNQIRKTQFIFSTVSILKRINDFDYSFLCNYLGLKSGIDSTIKRKSQDDCLVLVTLAKATSTTPYSGTYNGDKMINLTEMWKKCNEKKDFFAFSESYQMFRGATYRRWRHYINRGYKICGSVPPPFWSQHLDPSNWEKMANHAVESKWYCCEE